MMYICVHCRKQFEEPKCELIALNQNMPDKNTEGRICNLQDQCPHCGSPDFNTLEYDATLGLLCPCDNPKCVNYQWFMRGERRTCNNCLEAEKICET